MRDLHLTRIHWVPWGTGTPKDRDEVNKREVCECDGCVCDLDVIGASSMFMLINTQCCSVVYYKWRKRVQRV